jgi:hypothetical protein
VGKDGKEIPVCTHCGKKGHSDAKCWKKHGKPEKTGSGAGSGKSYDKSTFKCYKCGGPHMKRDCPKMGRGDKDDKGGSEGINGLFINVMMCEEITDQIEHKVEIQDEAEELSINAIAKKMNCAGALKGDDDVIEFLGDTGAQMHCMVKDPGTMWNEKKLGSSATFGNDSKAVIKKKGDLNVITETGMGMELKAIHVIPGCGKNIISLTQLQKEGWDYYSKSGKLFLKRDDKEIELKEKERNLHYLKVRIASDEDMKVFATEADVKKSAMVTEDEGEDDDDEMPELKTRDDDSDSSDDDTSDDEGIASQKPIARKKKTITWTDQVAKENDKRKTEKESIKATDTKRKLTMDMQDAHEKFGHHNVRRCKEMAEVLGVRLVGENIKCDACSMVNAKQRAVSKTTNTKATRVGERLFLDASGPFPTGINNSKYIFGAVDDFSGKMLNAFGSTKNKMVDFVKFAFEHFKGIEKPVLYLRLDNAGEHEILKGLCREHGTVMEYIPSGTSQLNGRIERRFPVAWNKAKIYMQNAGLTEEAKEKLWPKAMSTAILMGDLGPTQRNKIPAEELFTGKPSKLKPKDMVQWGRIGMVSNKDKIKAKMPAKGTPMMFVGYALDHPSGTYEMYNPATKRIITTDSVEFASFKRWKAKEAMPQMYNEEDDDVERTEDANEDTGEVAIKLEKIEKADEDQAGASKNSKKTKPSSVDKTATNVHRYNTRSKREQDIESGGNKDTTDDRSGGTEPTPVHIEGNYKVTGDTNVTPLTVEEIGTEPTGINFIKLGGNGNCDGLDDLINLIYNVSVNGDPGEPANIWEAINDEVEGDLWKMAATAECNNFLKRRSWKLVLIKDVPKDRRIVPCKEIFKRKDEIDGLLRMKVRIVSMGYMQIPGVDYTEKFAPTVTDEGQRTIFAVTIYYKNKDEEDSEEVLDPWTIDTCDIEAAFLEPRLEKPMYIKCPASLAACGFITMEEAKIYAVELWGSMYGNVNAALLWFREFVKYLKRIGMIQSKVDPCIFYLKEEGSKVPKLMVDVTVDDCAVAGRQSNVDWFMVELKKRFKITLGGRLKKHLGIDYEWLKDEKGMTCIVATMEKRVRDIIKSYENATGLTAKKVDSPCTPGKVLSKNDGEITNIEDYRSIVGKAMFFSTKLGYKTSSATRQLAGHLSCPGQEHWDALARLVGYLKQMKLPGMIYKSPESLRVISCEDTDFANCTETRRSVGSDVQTIGCTLVGWEVGQQDGVGTSTTDVEYRQLSKGCGNANFLMMLLREIAWVDFPAILMEDNMSAIYISKNKQVGKRTKHIDVKYHYTREFISEDEELGCARGTVEKIHTDDNPADIGTKSVSVKTFKHHEEDLDNGMPRLRKLMYGEDGTVATTLSGGMLEHGEIGVSRDCPEELNSSKT